jgi:hypothetical protein
LVAKGFDNIGNKKLVLFNNNILLTNSLIISLIIIISFFHIHQYYHTPLRHSWREAIEYIDTNADDQDIVMICPPTELRSAKFYNKRKKLKISPLSDESELITNTEGKRIWVVISDLTQFGDQISKETLVKHYNLLSEKDFFRLHVYVLADNSRRNR